MANTAAGASETMSAKIATGKYNKLKVNRNCVTPTDDHFTRYLGIAKSVLPRFL